MSSGSQVVPHGRTEGQTGMPTVIVAFSNFANASGKVPINLIAGQLV